MRSPRRSGRRWKSDCDGLALVRWDPLAEGVIFERVSSDAGVEHLFAENKGDGLAAVGGARIRAVEMRL